MHQLAVNANRSYPSLTHNSQSTFNVTRHQTLRYFASAVAAGLKAFPYLSLSLLSFPLLYSIFPSLHAAFSFPTPAHLRFEKKLTLAESIGFDSLCWKFPLLSFLLHHFSLNHSTRFELHSCWQQWRRRQRA